MKPKIGIILIIERGILEKYSLLAVKSIREFGGILSTAPIICYSPRKDYYPNSKTQLALKELQVEIITNDLNREFCYYSLANKPLVINEINNNYDFDYLLFFDSDTIVLGEPITLIDHKSMVAASPSWYNIVGVNNTQHPNYPYWETLAELIGFDLNSAPSVELHFEKESFLGNWNTGVLSFNNLVSSHVIENWKWSLEKILRNKLFPPKASIYLVEETAFAASVMLDENKVFNLDIYYNFPIEKKFDEKLRDIKSKITEAKVIHHLKHHNHLLSYEDWATSKEMENKRKWLTENMKQLGFNQKDKYSFKENLFFLRRIFKERSTYLLQKHLKL